MGNRFKAIKAFKFSLFVAFGILVLSCIPGNQLPKISTGLNDKVAHFIAYSVLSFVVFLETKEDFRLSNKNHRSFILIFLLIVAYGMGLEIIQGTIIPNRAFDMWDFAANTIGVVIGFVLYTVHGEIRKLRNKKL